MIRASGWILALALASASAGAGELATTLTDPPVTVKVKIQATASQAVLLSPWLADLNHELCAKARLDAGCSTEQLRKAAQRDDVQIYASLDEWAEEVVKQALATVTRQQAERLRALADSADLPALQAAVRQELGR